MNLADYKHNFTENNSIFNEVTTWSEKYNQHLTPSDLEALDEVFSLSEDDDFKPKKVVKTATIRTKSPRPKKKRAGKRGPKSFYQIFDALVVEARKNKTPYTRAWLVAKSLCRLNGGKQLKFPKFCRLKAPYKAALMNLGMLLKENADQNCYLHPCSLDISKYLMQLAEANKVKTGQSIQSFIFDKFSDELKDTLGHDVYMFLSFEYGKRTGLANPHMHGAAILQLHEVELFKAAFNKVCEIRTEAEKRAGHNVKRESKEKPIEERGLLNATLNWGDYCLKNKKKQPSRSEILHKFIEITYMDLREKYEHFHDETLSRHGDLSYLNGTETPIDEFRKLLHFSPKINQKFERENDSLAGAGSGL